MKKRELKRNVIRMIRGGEMYGYEMQKMLAAHGEKIELSHLYRTLKEMCDEGLLESSLRSGAHGPQTRQYRLSEKGRKELGEIFGEATELIHDFYEEYISNLSPEFFAERFQRTIREVFADRDSVAFVISESLTFLHRKICEGICMRPGAKLTYMIKPSHVKSISHMPNVTVLNGTLDDLPLKDRSLDALVIVDIEDAIPLRACCREFRRVLKDDGAMFGCAPFMGLGGSHDPLDVGEFMMKTRFDLNGRTYLDRETLRKALGEIFDYVDVTGVAHMTSFVAGLRPPRAEIAVRH